MLEALGPYKLLRLIGEGGMGQVYEATDGRSGERVAVKVLRGGAAASDREKELFAREARVGMDLEHPGLVRVRDVQILHTIAPYLVMDFLPGPTLKDLVAGERLATQTVLSLMIPVLETLTFLHNRRIVHRDIKTGNIMLDEDGRPRLMDFGLTTFSDETSLSRTGVVFGSPQYMSPEQGMGEELDARSDLFSLGVVFYEMLTGRQPFRGGHPIAIIYAIINEEPELLRRLRPELEAPFDQVSGRALAKKRDQRYGSAADFASDLRQLLDLVAGRGSAENLDLIAAADDPDESRPLLVGRGADFRALDSWLGAPNRPTAFFVCGEAGVGKTSLVRGFLHRLGSRAPTTLIGRTQPGRESFAYQPWLGALRPALLERNLLDEEAMSALLERRSAGGGTRAGIILHFLEGEGGAAENREQLFAALHLLLGALAEDENLVVWLEDLHRADRASLDLLSYLVRVPARELPPILVSYRDDEVDDGSALAELLRSLRREEQAGFLRVERLDETSTAELVSCVLSDTDLAARAAKHLHGESRGNPFILLELLEIMRSRDPETLTADPSEWNLPLPERLQDLVAHRLADLSEDEREMLDLAAVEGESFSAEVLAAVLEQRKIRVLRGLQKLQRRTRLLQAVEKRFFFDHALVHRVLYDALNDDLKATYHGMVGEVIERQEGDRNEVAAAIARHFLAAGWARRAVPYLIAAGRHARSLFALHEARRHLERAREEADLWWLEDPEGDARRLRREALTELGNLETHEGNRAGEQFFATARSLLTPGLENDVRADLDLRRGDALYFAGAHEQAAEEYRAALDHSPSDDKSLLARIMRSRARLESRLNEWDKATATCEAALDMAGDLPEEVLGIKHSLGLIHMARGQLGAARGLFHALASDALHLGNDSLHASALSNLGTVLWRLGESEEAVRCLEESRDLRERMGLLSETCNLLMNLAIIRSKTGRNDEARALLDQADKLLSRLEESPSRAHAANIRGNLEYRDGRLDRAMIEYRRAAELHEANGNRAGAAVALHNMGEILLDMGEPDQAAGPLEKALLIRAELDLKPGMVSSHRAHAKLLASHGKFEDAAVALDKALKLGRDMQLEGEVLKTELSRVDLLLASGQADEASRLLAEKRAGDPEWPPLDLSFEVKWMELRCAAARGEQERLLPSARALLEALPADGEPYRRLLILSAILEMEIPGSEKRLWEAERRSLLETGDYPWLE